eukprot:scaffold128493_cov64-Cyclotella_meneghiniana.AAC.4
MCSHIINKEQQQSMHKTSSAPTYYLSSLIEQRHKIKPTDSTCKTKQSSERKRAPQKQLFYNSDAM